MFKQYLNDALVTCEKLVDNQPSEQPNTDAEREWMEACQTVANILTSMGFVQEAYPWRSMALDQTPNGAKFYAESGRVCSQCEAWEEAIYFCRRTLEYEPNNAAVQCQLARVYHQIGDFTAETATLNSLLEQRPDKADAEGHYNLGQVLRGQSHTQAAIDCYRRAIAQDNQYEVAYYALGDLLAQQGNHAKTVELFSQMVEQLPKKAQAHYRLGKAYRQTQQLEQAIAEFRAAINLNPQLHWPYMGLINIQMERNSFDEAIATCRSAIEVSKQDESIAWAYCFLGNAAAKKGDSQAAALAHQQSFALRGWPQATARDYQFGLSWFSESIPTWAQHLSALNELSGPRPPLRALSLGAQDDGSLFWLIDTVLTEPDDRLICISDRISQQCQQNRAKLLEPDKLILQTENILAQLEDLPEKSLDFACIQSDCKQADYLESVSALIWKAIKPSGLLCFKNYRWQHPSDPSQSAQVGIDAFIASVSGDVGKANNQRTSESLSQSAGNAETSATNNAIEVLCRSHQVIIRKR